MFNKGDVVICTDTSGPSVLEIEKNREYVVEEVREMCYIKLEGVKQTQKMWRFRLVGNIATIERRLKWE